jgi:hypothetical protein
MPRRQSEEVNQSAKQVAEQEPDNARQTTGGRRQRPPQGIVKDQRGQDQPADKKRAQSKR